MSVAIAGLRVRPIERIADITLDYLDCRKEKQKCATLVAFFKEIEAEYASHTHYDTFIELTGLTKFDFDRLTLTKHLSSSQRAQLQSSVFFAARINGFIQQLHRRGGIAKIAADLAQYDKYPSYALVAHLKGGDVSEEQVTSTCLLYHAIQQFIKERHHVEIQSTPTGYKSYATPVVDNDFIPVLRTHSIFTNSELIRRFFNLNEEQKSALLNRLKSKPDSEQHYHTIELPLGPPPSPGHLLIAKIINRFKPVPITPHPLFPMLERTVIVVPSFSMLKEYPFVVYGKEAMPLMPLIGTCTQREIMHYKMQDKCVFQVGTREVPLEDNADGHWYGKYCRALHDAYHDERGNWLGAIGRRVVRYLAGHIFKADFDMAWAFLDGELWRKEETVVDSFNVTNIPWTEERKRTLVRNMALLPEFWEIEFYIDLKKLKPPEKALYDAILPTITPKEREEAERALFDYYKTLPNEDSVAQFRLGWMYYSGCGTPISHRSAVHHWELSGHAMALYNISIFYRKSPNDPFSRKEVYRYCLAAAEKGDRSAQFDLGWWHLSGDRFANGEKRYDLALDFFKKAAAQGHALALYNLGIMYRDGTGVEIDLKQALTYFQRAAALGQAKAQCEIGIWYFTGKKDILPQDFKEAKRYLEMAAAQNEPMSFYQLGLLYEEDLGVDNNLTLAYTHFKKGAELDEPHAANQLGAWYTKGQKGVVDIDLTKAAQYFAKAAALGNALAARNLKIVEGQMH